MYLQFILRRPREETQSRKSFLKQSLSFFSAVLPISYAFFCKFLFSFLPAHFICCNNCTCSDESRSLSSFLKQSLPYCLAPGKVSICFSYKPVRVLVTQKVQQRSASRCFLSDGTNPCFEKFCRHRRLQIFLLNQYST